MKVAFMGSDPIALPLLEELLENNPGGARLEAVFTQPDRKTGRGMRLTANAIKRWAQDKGLPVHQPRRCGEAEAALLRSQAFDLVIVMAYGQILPSSILDTPPLGFVNLHASLLPRLRGASPIHTAVALGLPESGVSFMRIIPAMDAGPVADAERVPIDPRDTAPDLHAKLAQACRPLLRRCLPPLAKGGLVFRDQDPAEVTYCRIIDKTDAHLDFREPAAALANRVRAFTPWPGTSFPFNDAEIRILEAEVEATTHHLPAGSLLEISEGSLPIACGEGTLLVKRMQRPGGKPLDTVEFLRGFPMEAGSVIPSREMRPLEARSPFPYRRKRNSARGNT